MEHVEFEPPIVDQLDTFAGTGIACGLSNAEIGERCYLSEATVKTHVSRALSKLELRDCTQAVVWAYEHGDAKPDQTRSAGTFGSARRSMLGSALWRR